MVAKSVWQGGDGGLSAVGDLLHGTRACSMPLSIDGKSPDTVMSQCHFACNPAEKTPRARLAAGGVGLHGIAFESERFLLQFCEK